MLSDSDAALLGSLRVLYVEDDPAIREELALFLRRRVGELVVASDGMEGLARFEPQRIDVVITDIRMPRLDGLAMSREIHERDPDAPLIVTTAHNDEAYFLRAIALGIDGYVLKPIDPHILTRELVKCGRLRRRKQADDEARRYVQCLLDTQPNLIMVLSGGHVEHLNQAFLNFLGVVSLAQIQERAIDIGILFQTPKGIPLAQLDPGHGWVKSLSAHLDQLPILYGRRPTAEDYDLHAFALSYKRVEARNKILVTLADIAAIETELRQLEQLAYNDPLTGVCNRNRLNRLFHTEMERARRHQRPLAVILLDIDHFKKVNDTHGHAIGDDVLRELVHRVQDKLRASDILARLGGEEFVMVIPECDRPSATVLAEKLRGLIEQNPFPVVGRITSSFGVTQFDPGDSMRSILERADKALYAAKAEGRNRVISL
jgi:diguanylate cyclase (GGDEF)-like protein